MKVPEPRRLDSGTWYIQLRLGGVSIPVSAATASECKRQAALIKAEHAAGQKRVTRCERTLSEAIDAYIAKRAELSPATVRGYVAIRDNRFRSIAGVRLSAVHDWQRVVDSERDTCGAKTIKNAWGLVGAVLRENKLAVPDVTLPKVVQPEHAWLQPAQIRRFVKAVHGTSGEIPALLALHGLRRSEVYALRWEDVELKSGLLHVRRSAVIDRNNELVQRDATKTEAGTRTVPIMIPELRAALEAAEGREGLVVRQSIAYLYQQVNEACERAGLPLVGVHGLRHSFASLAYHLGWGEMETMSVGGWSDRETMHRIYTHLAETDREKAQKKMEKFYKNANRNAYESNKA